MITKNSILNAKIIRNGRLFQKDDRKKGKSWVILPFLCEVNSRNVQLDHENTEFEWINYKDVKRYSTVPGLQKDLKVLGLM